MRLLRKTRKIIVISEMSYIYILIVHNMRYDLWILLHIVRVKGKPFGDKKLILTCIDPETDLYQVIHEIICSI